MPVTDAELAALSEEQFLQLLATTATQLRAAQAQTEDLLVLRARIFHVGQRVREPRIVQRKLAVTAGITDPQVVRALEKYDKLLAGSGT